MRIYSFNQLSRSRKKCERSQVMKTFFLIVLWVSYCSGFQFEDCGGAQKTLFIEDLDLTPSPFTVPGNLKMSARVRVSKPVPAKTVVDIKMIRILNIVGQKFNLTIPCIKNLGSCKLAACDMLKEHMNRVCSLWPEGKPCECPIAAGVYEGKGLNFPLPDFGPLLSQLAAGDYHLEMRARDLQTDVEIGCMRISMSIKSISRKY
ncbi:ganglioside GM2 activator-like [Limulus polyphemus]|uniref:Ganglioside GM2 activator-like n=1 Tax=Limulus polyphemus TaxID=6850 RepID=A0ABM1SQC9_LIMPO|nr:ganglioside GM2 activator-like [Limulus polyphemus]